MMIGYLQGKLLHKEESSCLVLTPGGVGYELFLPTSVSLQLPEVEGKVSFYVQTIVREDALDLYGFLEQEDKEAFNDLLRVSKLGPKTALAILSTFSPGKLFSLVADEDVKSLTQVPGVGVKSAKRIIWELKERGVNRKGALKPSSTASGQGSMFADALAGLVNLGYGEDEVAPLLKKILDQEPDLLVTEAIRSVLKTISRSKFRNKM